MSMRMRSLVKWGVIGCAIAVAAATSAPMVEAAVGSVVTTTAIPTAALCGGSTGGTAVAVINGGKVFNTPPIPPLLIVTSCGTNIFFLDPSTNPATLVKTITTTITPLALTLRADKGDLLACTATNQGTKLSAIDVSPFNNVADGTVTDVSNAPSGSSCNAIAWDVRRVLNQAGEVTLVPTIYQTATTGTSVLRYAPQTKGNVTAENVATGCPTSPVVGVAVVGQSLFAGCAGGGNSNSTIVQVDKTSGTFVRSFGNSNSKPAGFGLDPITLGPQFKELLWTKQQTSIVLEGIEIPGGTSGQIVGAAVAFPAACPPTYPTQPNGSPLDSDGDSLLDCWEDGTLWSDGLPGISFTGGWVAIPRPASERDLTLCIDAAGNNVSSLPQGQDFATFLATRCVSKIQKDIVLELDWMADALAGHTHDPRVSAPDAVPHVIAAFANAPTPIKLLVEFSDPIPHTDSTALTPCTAPPATGDASFDQLKATHFGKPNESTNKLNARHFTSHYALFVHFQSGSTSTGCAEVRGNDLMVSLGAWGTFTFPNNVIHGVGTPEQQEGTLMHELGHNLGLLHGGFEHVNCKPNYISVMSYSRQFPRPPAQACPACTGFPLDYSRAKLPDLNENSLSEGNSPLGPLFVGDIIFGPPVVQQSGQPAKPVVVNVAVAGDPVDWNRSGTAGDATGVSRDLTSLTSLGCSALPLQPLVSFDDWSNLHFNFRASVDFASGASSTHTEDKKQGNKEIELDEALELSPYLMDLKPADQNNTVNANSKQNLSVAILSQPGDATGAGFFDATTVDPATVTLRGKFPFTWVLPVDQNAQGTFQCKTIDSDGDHIADLVCAFTIPKGTLSTAETTVILEGRTFAGEPVLASDFINVR